MNIQFLAANWIEIVFILAFIITLYTLYRLGKKDIIRRIIYNIIKQADVRFDELSDANFNKVYMKLPKVIRVLCSDKDTRNIIDDILNSLQDMFKVIDIEIIEEIKETK